MIIKDTWETNEPEIIENNNRKDKFSNKKEIADNLSINEIQKESIKIAIWKLHKIMEPSYSAFSVRFVNIEEYKEIITNGCLPEAKEIFVFGQNSRNKLSKQSYMHHVESSHKDFFSFADYLKFGWENGDSREYVARVQTNWEIGNYNLFSTQLLFSYFKKTKEEMRDKKLTKDKYNKYFANSLRDKIVSESRYNIKETVKKSKEWSVIRNFINNPDFLFENPNNLRTLFNALAYAKYEQQTKQYHIAVIYDSDAVVPISDGNNYHHWSNISSDSKPHHIVAAIAVMPNKELWNKMTEISSGSGKLAHPIFNRTGELKWPKLDKDKK